jgi:uncharacterized cupredoxin-like copper-binding protein
MPIQIKSIRRRNNQLMALPLAAALFVSLGATTVLAQSGHGSGHGQGMSPMKGNAMQDGSMHGAGMHGQPGKKSQAKRTVMIEIRDNYFTPEKVQVKKGETVRFVIANKGKLVHEFNIGTPEMHKAHQKQMQMMVEHGAIEPDKINRDKMMMKMPDGHTMEHNDPNSTLVEPGKTGEVIWKFSKDGNIEFGCNMPGHYDAGMVGKFSVE